MPPSADPYRPPALPPPPVDSGEQANLANGEVPTAKGSRWVGTFIFMIVFAAVGDIVFRPLLDIYLLSSEARSWGILLGIGVGGPIGFRLCRALEVAVPGEDSLGSPR